MRHWTTPRVVNLVVCAALVFAPSLGAQRPGQPGKIHISSTPDGAQIKINGELMGQKTNTELVVAPGNYSVETSGQSGKSTCIAQSFKVEAGKTTNIACSGGAWTGE